MFSSSVPVWETPPSFLSRLHSILALPTEGLTVENVVQLFETLHDPSISAASLAEYAATITDRLTSFSLSARGLSAVPDILRHSSFLGRFFALSVIAPHADTIEPRLRADLAVQVIGSISQALADTSPQSRLFVNKAVSTFSTLATVNGAESGIAWLSLAGHCFRLGHNLVRIDDVEAGHLPAIDESCISALPPVCVATLFRICCEFSSSYTSQWWPTREMDDSALAILSTILRDVKTLISWALSLGTTLRQVGLTDEEAVEVKSLAVECLCVWKPNLFRSSRPDIAFALGNLTTDALLFLSTGASPQSCETVREHLFCNRFSSVSDTEFIQLGLACQSPGYLARLEQVGVADEESLPFLHLFLTFAAEQVVRTCRASQALLFLPSVADPTQPVVQDVVMELMSRCDFDSQPQMLTWYLEFWTAVVDCMTESIDLKEAEGWLEVASTFIEQAIDLFLHKLTYPPDSDDWDSDTTELFLELRRDFQELLLSCYSICGPRILVRMVKHYGATFDILQPDWSAAEVILWAVATIADEVTDANVCYESVWTDDMLTAVLEPVLRFQAIQTGWSKLFERTVVMLIANLSTFFRRQGQLVEPTVTLLYSIIRSGRFATGAADAIHSICKLSSPFLAAKYDDFLQASMSVFPLPHLDRRSKMKIVGALSAIAGAKCRLVGSLEPLYVLLDIAVYERNNSQACHELAVTADPLLAREKRKGGLEHAVNAAQMLSAMAKTFHSSELFSTESPTDTGSEGESAEGQIVNLEQRVKQDQVRERLEEVIQSIVVLYGRSELVLNPLCGMFKAGFAETSAGPFVFSTGFFVHLTGLVVQQTNVLTTGWLQTTASFFSSYVFDGCSAGERAPLVASLHGIIRRIVHQIAADPTADEDIVVSTIKTSTVMLKFYQSDLVIDMIPFADVSDILRFVLLALGSKQLDARSQATQFWIKFLSLPAGTGKTQEWLDGMVSSILGSLAETTVSRTMATGLRGEMAATSKLLHTLVHRTPAAKEQIRRCVADQLGSTKANNRQAEAFIRALSTTRARKATQTFWEECLGLKGL